MLHSLQGSMIPLTPPWRAHVNSKVLKTKAHFYLKGMQNIKHRRRTYKCTSWRKRTIFCRPRTKTITLRKWKVFIVPSEEWMNFRTQNSWKSWRGMPRTWTMEVKMSSLRWSKATKVQFWRKAYHTGRTRVMFLPSLPMFKRQGKISIRTTPN